ncbi:MAG: phage tail protein [Hyphomicrobiales bacterium]
MNVACLNDCLHHDDVSYSQNLQHISLDKLATKMMGRNVACLAHINGKMVIDDWQQIVTANDNVVFEALAAGGDKGGDSKDGFRMIAQIALLVGVAVFAGPLGAALASATGGFLTAAVATQLVSASLLFVGNLAINALFPQSGTEQAEQFKTLQPQNNVARIGQPIAEVFGEMRVFPDLIAAPKTRFINNKPELSETFHYTAGQATISDMRLGNTPIGDFTDLTVVNQQDGDVGTVFNVPEARGIELLMPRDDGLPSQDLWGSGEGFTSWFDLCPPKETLNNDGIYQFLFEIGLGFARGVGNEFGVVSSTAGAVDEYDYHQGVQLYWRVVDDVGLPNGASGNFEVKVPAKPSDLGDNETYNATVIFVDGNWPDLTLLAGIQSVPASIVNKRVQVRLKRTVEKSDDSNVATSVSILSLNGFGATVRDVDGVIAKLKAGQMKRLPVNGSLTLNAVVKRKIHTFKKVGANFVYDALKFSNTPSQVAYHFMHEHFGSFGEVAKNADLDALWFLHNMNLVKGEMFNATINTQKKWWDWLGQVCFGMRVKPIRRGARISFIRDMAEGIPNFGTVAGVAGQGEHQFNPFNTVRDSMNVSYALPNSDEIHDGVKLEFIDARVWEYNDYILNLDGSGTCDNPLVVDAKGVTDLATIKALAAHMVAAMKYRKIHASFKTELDGLLPNVGNSVFLQNGLIDEGVTARIYSVDGLNIGLERPLAKTYGFAVLRVGEARASQKIAVTIASDGKSIALAEMPKIDGVAVQMVSFFDEPESPDTITFYNVLDDEPCLVRITNIKYNAAGALISGFVDDDRVYN